MKMTVQLDEDELKQAVKSYLTNKGFDSVESVSISHDGYENSPDPRESGITYSASAEVTK